MAKQTDTISAISTVWSTYDTVEVSAGSGLTESRLLAVWATTTNSTTGAAGTLSLVLRHKSTKAIIAKEDATITQTATRTGADGASGDYVCTVDFGDSAGNKFDLLGGCEIDSNDYEWAIGISANAGSGDVIITGGATVTVYLDTDYAV